MDLVVAVDARAIVGEDELRGSLASVGIVHHRADRGRSPDLRDGLPDGCHRGGIARGGGVEGPLPPQDEVGPRRRAGEAPVQRDVLPGDQEILLSGRGVRRRTDIDLDDGDVERSAGRFREGQRDRCEDEGDRQNDEPCRPNPRAGPAPDRREQQGVRHHDDERDPPDTGERRERKDRTVVDLRDPDAPPGEPTQREHAADPVDRRPQGGEPDRRPDGPLVPEHRRADGAHHGDRSRRERREREPRERAEEEDPIQGRPEERQPEDQPEEGSSSGTGSAQRPEQRDQRHERERPHLRRREGERKQQSARDVEGERGRERDGRRAAQAQSRQSILRLSASWLRCFTR